MSIVVPDDERRNSSNIVSESVFNDIRFVDWYGNLWLHHAFANTSPDILTIRRILANYPESAGIRNQFGRIALHYCLDRSRGVELDIVRLLLEYYPEGAFLKDNNNESPYEIALKWKHSNSIHRALLNVDPYQDYGRYLELRYGCLTKIFPCFFPSLLLDDIEDLDSTHEQNDLSDHINEIQRIDDDEGVEEKS